MDFHIHVPLQVHYLSQHAGHNARRTTSNVLRALMTDDVMILYSRDGRRNKKSFADAPGGFVAIIQGK